MRFFYFLISISKYNIIGKQHEKGVFMKKIILLLGFFLMGCSADVFLTKDNVGQTVDILLNNRVIIKLDENPTTGYQWKFEIYDEKKQIVNNDIVNIQINYEQTIKDPRIAGAGGIKTLKVNFSRIGNYTIIGRYERSWEQNSAIKEVQYKIFVK